ncbi:MAG TPA: NAD-dependent epimerase/dehydratase family protein [Longimicrobiales bacterium]|nr:NAD-dependent epimerase/dehydratase family protein [Longimicrobiales bacterium]
MSVVVYGADGYIGWSLVCAIATQLNEPIIAVDDLSKRERVNSLGFTSGVEILPFEERIARLRRVTGRTDITGVVADIRDSADELMRTVQPSAVVHLAQIPSAPYSMMDATSAIETLVNNEAGNLALLFALKQHSPNTHLVKMGSMGEYARCGLPIEEGYYQPTHNGVIASRAVPFPREADDVYHITKINDSNFIGMACRQWGLAITDVMQSIVYGVSSPLSREHPELHTRFDFEPVFGSVLNRFVAQAVSGQPLTVYGGGTATTGLISLRDSVNALTTWLQHPCAPGMHRVINQATETRITIRELAILVAQIAQEAGIEVTIDCSLDPRHEAGKEIATESVVNTTLLAETNAQNNLVDDVRQLFRDVQNSVTRFYPAAAPPCVDWRAGRESNVGPQLVRAG